MTIANSKNTKLLTLIILLLIILSGAFYILSNYNKPKPAINNTNNNQQINNNSQELKPIIPGWKVYESKEYGLRVDYPKEWTAKETGEYTAISLVSPETLKDFEENFEQIKDFYAGNFNEYFAYNSDVSIYHYSLLEDRYGVTTIEELTKINDDTIGEIGKIKINGVDATEFVWRGEGENYVIIFESNGYFYEIVLNRISSKEDISDTVKQILSTFQLIK